MQLRKLLRHLTKDRNRDPPALQEVLTVEQIGPRRFRTPEGFLLCEAVPIARMGIMPYGPGEVPVEAGADGVAWVTRDATELFRPETLLSFVGKPVTDEHPDDDVTPDNWSKLARGTVFNVRQGAGEDADVILADLLITDARMIRDIDAMKREVSAGYDADYEDFGDGQGRQSNILGNHVALVEKGRCGPRCAIGDHSTLTSRKLTMATQQSRGKSRTPPAQRRMISKATLDALAQELGAEVDDPDASTMDDGELSGPADSHTHIHIHGIGSTGTGQGGGAASASAKDEGAPGGNASEPDPMEARFVSIENSVKELTALVQTVIKGASGQGGSGGEDPSGKRSNDADPDADDKNTGDENPFAKKDGEGEKKDEEDKKGKTNDSAALETSYREVLAGCEVLVPGFRMPTFDSKAKRSATMDAMCAARRKALDAFNSTTEGASILSQVAGTATIDVTGMACQDAAVLWRAAVGAKKLINNGNATRDATRMADPNQGNPGSKKGPSSLAELNKMHREHYAKRQGTAH
jgi:hypothetical protein